MAQATFLTSQALELIKHPSIEDEATCVGRMAQLRRTSLALVHTTDAEASVRRLEFCAQSGLSFRSVVLPSHVLRQAQFGGQLTRCAAPSYYFKISIYRMEPTIDKGGCCLKTSGRRVAPPWTDCRQRPLLITPVAPTSRKLLTLSRYS